MQIELFKATLKQTQSTWQRYIASYCLLQLGFIIDVLGGSGFLLGHQAIELAGFKVVREAISLTYGVLFLVFVVSALFESRILRQCFDATGHEVLLEPPELKLWLVSPFSTFRIGPFRVFRIIFWLLFIFGFSTLLLFIDVHLVPPALLYPKVLRTPPLIDRGLFVAIGWFDLAVLLLCIPLGWQIFENLRAVASFIFKPADGMEKATGAA